MTQTIEQLTARVRELEEENARLRKVTHVSLPTNTMEQWVASEIRKATSRTKDQLAAEQLNNKRLREALEFLNARIVTMDLGGVVERALSLHASTEALDAYVAEKVKEYGDEVASQKHCYAEAVAHYEKQLAVEQLNNKRLREALEAVIKVHGYESGIPVEALARPSDTSVLDAYVAEKVKEAMK